MEATDSSGYEDVTEDNSDTKSQTSLHPDDEEMHDGQAARAPPPVQRAMSARRMNPDAARPAQAGGFAMPPGVKFTGYWGSLAETAARPLAPALPLATSDMLWNTKAMVSRSFGVPAQNPLMQSLLVKPGVSALPRGQLRDNVVGNDPFTASCVATILNQVDAQESEYGTALSGFFLYNLSDFNKFMYGLEEWAYPKNMSTGVVHINAVDGVVMVTDQMTHTIDDWWAIGCSGNATSVFVFPSCMWDVIKIIIMSTLGCSAKHNNPQFFEAMGLFVAKFGVAFGSLCVDFPSLDPNTTAREITRRMIRNVAADVLSSSIVNVGFRDKYALVHLVVDAMTRAVYPKDMRIMGLTRQNQVLRETVVRRDAAASDAAASQDPAAFRNP